jgi:hypothetical protein
MTTLPLLTRAAPAGVVTTDFLFLNGLGTLECLGILGAGGLSNDSLRLRLLDYLDFKNSVANLVINGSQ